MSDEAKEKHKEYQKNYLKVYRDKKKQELQSVKKEQVQIDKNVVLNPPKTKLKSWLYQNITHVLLMICLCAFMLIHYLL